jgi:hypothetical protein
MDKSQYIIGGETYLFSKLKTKTINSTGRKVGNIPDQVLEIQKLF